MNNLNSILIEGNLIRDPQTRTTTNGTMICTFSIATNKYYKKGEMLEREVSFFDVETWSKLAEACYARGKKGRGVRIVGRIKQERWNDKDGKARSKVILVAEHVEFRHESKKLEETVQQEEFVAEEVAEAIPF